ncbi:hypothetical protein GGR25_000696 [Kaistia hirudinis]|uniref:Uncharacterized protein n=1 Tax=Kaistia hirudinis TaxID=1293440 RepID=A0A840AKV6_9HYPH|nr:hypothetical protein [Kaistia hirudinis]MBB3929677.1 hypothetical protein [Kaistia hirudinis]
MTARDDSTASDPHAVSLYLSDIHNFFQTPELDPFLGENLEDSGIEQLMDTLKARPGLAARVTRIVIHLPEAKIEPGLIGKTRAAIIAYCNAQIRVCQQRKRDIHLQARRALPIGFVFWTVCFVLSLFFEQVLGSETALGRVFSEGFIIAGWVGLWHPAELLLYEWRPYARSIRLYEQIRTMDVAIVSWAEKSAVAG